ncbi:MAG TPA: hypothetical protein VGL83_19240 [Stellaceae bacterium]
MDDKAKTNTGRESGEHARDSGANQGEGDYRSARAYDKHVRETVESGQVEKKAHEAEKAIEGKEGEALRRAEAEGKRHSHGEDPQLNKKK